MARDADVGINARMTYSLEDDLEESSTFIIETDPVTQEGVVVLAKVSTQYTVKGEIFCLNKFNKQTFVFTTE